MNRYTSSVCAIAIAMSLALSATADADTYNLTIDKVTIDVDGKPSEAMGINGGVPGPVLRFKEGEDIVLNVTNRLDEDSSIHWHGLILPYTEDGVPGISFAGIKPGATHTYRFTARQSGTYWYHSHSGMQEQSGVYGAIVIEPREREPFRFDRDYVIVLSDWHVTPPAQIMANLKKRADYYNPARQTVFDFFNDASRSGLGAAFADRQDWGQMRMTPTDIADVAGYTFLVNGRNAAQNWSALFKPGERIRLRFVNAAAMTYFDVRIPGLRMTVVQSDGNNVQPVTVEEFRIAVAETYDVIVRPREDKPFTVFAESMDRTGYARATLAPRDGMEGPVPPMRPRPLLTMSDMGMAHKGMGHGTATHGAAAPDTMGHGAMGHENMGHGTSGHGGPGKTDPFYAPGSGLMPKAANGGKFLSYADLKAQKPLYRERKPAREIELRLTGNMERYFWSINGRKYSEAPPIRLTLGERVRFKFVNETMMTHPMHLHGMWTILDNGSGKWNPAKHTVSVSPGTTLYAEIEADAPGEWAFHCHLLYHMASGMFRKVIVEAKKGS